MNRSISLGMWLFDHFLRQLGGDSIYSIYGAGCHWVMYSWRHSKWKSLWTFAVIKFKIWIKEPPGGQDGGDEREGMRPACEHGERSEEPGRLLLRKHFPWIQRGQNWKLGLEVGPLESLPPLIWILKMNLQCYNVSSMRWPPLTSNHATCGNLVICHLISETNAIPIGQSI